MIIPAEAWSIAEKSAVVFICIVLLFFLYKLFDKVLVIQKETSEAITKMTTALENNTQVVNALKDERVTLQEVTAAVENNTAMMQNNTEVLGKLQEMVSQMGGTLTALCTLMGAGSKRQ